MPAAVDPTRETALRDSLAALIDSALAHMLESGSAEPAWMRLICDATATLAALDRRRD